MKAWWRRRPLVCLEVGRALQSYLDGRLDDQWATRVAGHLEHCRRCGLEAATYAELKASLRRRELVLPDDTLAGLRAFASRLASGDAPVVR